MEMSDGKATDIAAALAAFDAPAMQYHNFGQPAFRTETKRRSPMPMPAPAGSVINPARTVAWPAANAEAPRTVVPETDASRARNAAPVHSVEPTALEAAATASATEAKPSEPTSDPASDRAQATRTIDPVAGFDATAASARGPLSLAEIFRLLSDAPPSRR